MDDATACPLPPSSKPRIGLEPVTADTFVADLTSRTTTAAAAALLARAAAAPRRRIYD